MSQNSTRSSELHLVPGATLRSPHASAEPVPQELLPPTSPPRPSLRSRVGKYALIVGGLCAAVGAVEGALTGAMLAPSRDPSGLILVVALDRFILLGLAGAGIGAAIGAVDWCLGTRKKKVKN